MGCKRRPLPLNWLLLLLLLLFLPPLFFSLTAAQRNDTLGPYKGGSTLSPNTNTPALGYPITGVGRRWTNDGINTTYYADGSSVRPILLRGRSSASFACGFFCSYNPCEALLFAIFLVQTNNRSLVDNAKGFPQVVWSANRNTNVKGNVSLEFTPDGDLRLTDLHAGVVWSSNTSGKSVTVMNLTEKGNLVIYNSSNHIVWQSFDHPTDSLLPDQPLPGKNLIANDSKTNTSEGIYHFVVNDTSVYASVGVLAPQIYYFKSTDQKYKDVERITKDTNIFPSLTAGSFLRFESDGHLRHYVWSSEENNWKVKKDILNDYIGDCDYPAVCENYGICSDGQCSCPLRENYFQAKNPTRPNSGCFEVNQLSCESQKDHKFLTLENTSYFGYAYVVDAMHSNMDVETCKEACLRDCSCKAAFLRFGTNSLRGDCYMTPVVFSMIENDSTKRGYNSTAFIKVQDSVADEKQRMEKRRWRVMVSGIAAFLAIILAGIGICFVVAKKRRKRREEKEFQFTHLPGMPTKFSYQELRAATDNFSRMLGEGGFGCVFEGTLSDGMRVAVKLLGYKGQGMKEFVAEVETLGSIHHFNLVRLVGYCAEKLHRLLVYEFMPNGSLEKWIFHGKQNDLLDWPTKSKIILDVARGLSYLHEDCRHRIIHMDIKPQNILLDDNFNAKVSDFGLAKLVDRDQSQVFTTLRGTPGYLAPEWLNSVITEKVDVYSFGVVVLEMVCGKKSVDCSRSPGSVHLISVLMKAAEENRLIEIVDKDFPDIHDYEGEATKMLRIAMWCLQGDYNRRPSMSVVVKVLEGLMDVEPELEISFFNPAPIIGGSSSSTPLPSVDVSGPR